MKEPETKLDPRFSDPGAVPTRWAETLRILETAQMFWISTVRADGRPHVTPLVAVWLDGALHFCTGPGEQKALNLTHNPHVTLTTGRNDWEQGIDVVLEGEAVRVADDRELQDLAEAWGKKWNGQWQYEPRDGAFHQPDGGTALVFAVRPTQIFAFAKGTFGQTRYRF